MDKRGGPSTRNLPKNGVSSKFKQGAQRHNRTWTKPDFKAGSKMCLPLLSEWLGDFASIEQRLERIRYGIRIGAVLVFTRHADRVDNDNVDRLLLRREL